ncbi:MAG: alcohol dehydrogenase [Ardenticatenia bacterium]|jgi:alcohol dehydrogenase class IV|nr:MAG: alcohol dehydrogenase [Ardenticatenia bacterium]
MIRDGDESVMAFEFATAGRILFGRGTFRQAGPIAAGMGRHALVVTGLSETLTQPLVDLLREHKVAATLFSVSHEPTTELVLWGVQRAQEAGCDLVIGIGGGSAIDASKAIAGLLTNPGDLFDYLEVIGKAQAIREPAAPLIAIATTAGTGAEVTRNAVIISPQHRVKVSMRSPLLLPRVAIVDPELTYSVPPAVTASTGLDALTQVLEPYVSSRANAMIDPLVRDGMARAARSLRRAYEHGDDPDAREDMALVSLFGGLALANAGLGAVHGFAAPLGGMLQAPHGAICARLLPFVMEVNIRALRARQPDHYALPRYDEIARILTGNPQAVAADGIAWVHELCQVLRIQPLSAYGLTQDDIPKVVERGAAASSMKGNPIPLTPEEMTEILTRAL